MELGIRRGTMAKYYLKQPLIVDKPSRVIVKSDDGRPQGEYNAFYRPQKDAVDLYPAKGLCSQYSKHTVSIFNLIKDY